MRTQISLAGICLSASLSFAFPGFNFFVQGDSNVVIGGDNTGGSIGVQGTSTYGPGVRGFGVIGVRGEGNLETWANWGVQGTAGQGWYHNVGVDGYAEAYNNGTTAFGVRGESYVPNGGWSYGVAGYADGYDEGRTGIGIYGYACCESTDYAGAFDGNVIVNGTFSNPSDLKFKKNVKALAGGLGSILALKPKSYEMRTDEYKGRLNFSKGKKLGLIAQDVEAVLPELVSAARLPAPMSTAEINAQVKKEPTEFKSVDYLGLIPVLVSAVQEQQAEIQILKAKLKALGQ